MMDVSGNRSTERVRLHRQRLGKECTRLDVTIGSDVADEMKSLARTQGVPLWDLVERAIDEYLKKGRP